MTHFPVYWLLQPASLAALFSDECVEYRAEFNQFLRSDLWRHRSRPDLTSAEAKYLEHIDQLPPCNLLVPDKRVLMQLANPIEVIGTVLRFQRDGSDKTVLFVQDHSRKIPSRTGCGKSALGLELLGVHVPYEGIAHPTLRDSKSEARSATLTLGYQLPIALHRTNLDVTMVSCDMPYIGVHGRCLHAAPIIGEPLLGQWDLARTISRVFDCHYRECRRKISWLQEYVETLAYAYYLDFGRNGVFDRLDRTYQIDAIVIINAQSSACDHKVQMTQIPTYSAMDLLGSQLVGNPGYHDSTFWQINTSEHRRRVNRILSQLPCLPEIWLMTLPHDKRGVFLHRGSNLIRRNLFPIEYILNPTNGLADSHSFRPRIAVARRSSRLKALKAA